MMNRILLCLVLAVAAVPAMSLSAAEKPEGRQTQNLLLITIDGLRWQEVFGGADETLMNSEFGGVKSESVLRQRFWRSGAEERRVALLPHFWTALAPGGVIYGNPSAGSVATVTNQHCFSYPGYNEILTGYADPAIDSNDKAPNPNVTVLEWLHGRDGFGGRIEAFTSWDVFPYIINSQRSGIPVDAGWEGRPGNAPPSELDMLADEIPHYWDNVRYDYFTFRAAVRAVETRQPRVVYVAFGETDDWAHAGRYDLYLDAARRTDSYIQRLWESMQKHPQYAGKTALLITTDHGRGDSRVEWKSHGADLPGSEQIWIALFGPDIAPRRAPRGRVHQSQVAATAAAVLGEDYHSAVPRSAPPLDAIQGE